MYQRIRLVILQIVKPFVFLFIAGSILVHFTACTKYEDGPLISLRTKKARLSNHWQIDSIFVNQTFRPELKDKFTIKIDRRGDFTWYEDPYEHEGMWSFDQNDENVILVFTINNHVAGSKLWEIKRLANRELWVEENLPDSLVYIQFVPVD